MKTYLPILATLAYLAFAGWLGWQVAGVLIEAQEAARGALCIDDCEERDEN